MGRQSSSSSSSPLSSNAAPLLRGYLPLRVSLPDEWGDVFLFVKAQAGPMAPPPSFPAGRKAGKSKTLFIANAPSIPGLRTSFFLRALFERYGDVERVTVVRNPRLGGVGVGGGRSDVADSADRVNTAAAAADDDDNDNDNDDTRTRRLYLMQLFSIQSRRFYHCRHGEAGAGSGSGGGDGEGSEQHDGGVAHSSGEDVDPMDEGKFARVEFASAGQMSRAIKSLAIAMGGGGGGGGKGKRGGGDGGEDAKSPPSIRFGELEIRELRDRSERSIRAKGRREAAMEAADADVDDCGSDDDHDHEHDHDQNGNGTRGMDALVQRHRMRFVPRPTLLEACGAVVARYEKEEEKAERRARAAKEGPDEDGFITVTRGASVRQNLEGEDNVLDEEEDGIGVGGESEYASGRRKAGKRSRGGGKKKKGLGGASELKDFYRFQTRESRKRNIQDLQKKFEEDLERVKRMKEEKKYRPF